MTLLVHVFLPHDPQAYINPKYKDDVEEEIFFMARLENVPSEIQQTDILSITLLYNKVEEMWNILSEK